jgi:diguanylate cyclase (GGDEF)-like protein/PAS domain S-box-containing protein
MRFSLQNGSIILLKSIDFLSNLATLNLKGVAMHNQPQRILHHFNAVQKMANVGAWEVDLIKNELYWSDQTYRIHDTSPNEYSPCVETAIQFYAPEWIPIITDAVENAINTGEGFDLELEIITAKQRRIWVHTYCSVETHENKVIKLFGAFQDIDDLKSTRRELEKSEFMFRSQFDLGNTGLAITSLEKGWLRVNNKLTEILGYSKEELFQLTWAELTHPDDLAEDVAQFEELIADRIDSYKMDKRFYRKDGAIVYVHLTVSCYRKNDKAEFIIASLEDITEKTLSEQKIQKLAHFDSLTGLPNRIMAETRFQHSLQAAERDNSSVGIMFLDLDEFKSINDSQGHSAGDLFLVEIANRLKTLVRKADTICRQGGDEFLIIIESINAEKQILSLAQKALDCIKRPYSINGINVSTSVSIGIAIAPLDGKDFETLCRHADMAMYQAKNDGRNAFHFFNQRLEENAESKLQLLSDLRIALEQNQFELYYQPKINLADNKIMGAEALIRWNHPEKGLVPPIDFIPLAESSGLIIELGQWIIEQACKRCKAWQEQGLGNLCIAVNVSAVQFKRDDFFNIVQTALNKTKLLPEYLELEITESLLIVDSKRLADLFAKLDALGTKMSIDDFGTGYSNLGYLKKFQIDTLKIDRSFISKLQLAQQDQAIVQAILQMAKSLELDVVAEGVEDETTAELLKALNCQFAQGYFWSKPVTHQEFAKLTRQQNSLSN